jgi:CheY-like chemotaxis protein
MRTILIVDDEFGIAESVGSLFSDEGFRVFTAVNGKQGLERVADSAPEIVLIDYMMPVMNGAEMLQALRAQPRYAQLPVVLMSGVAEAIVKKDPLGHGYSAFVRKPFDAFTILRIVRELLGS